MKSATAAASIRQAPRTAQSPESPSMAAKRGVAATAQSSVARSASFLARSKSSGAMGLAGTVLAVVSDGFFFTQREMTRSEEHTSELQSRLHLVCRLLLEKKKIKRHRTILKHEVTKQLEQ